MKKILILGRKNPYGENAVVNGNFDSDSVEWVKSGGAYIANGVLTLDTTGGLHSEVLQVTELLANVSKLIEFEVLSSTDENTLAKLRLYRNSMAGTSDIYLDDDGNKINAIGMHRITIPPDQSFNQSLHLRLYVGGNDVLIIDNIKAREIL